MPSRAEKGQITKGRNLIADVSRFEGALTHRIADAIIDLADLSEAGVNVSPKHFRRMAMQLESPRTEKVQHMYEKVQRLKYAHKAKRKKVS